MKKLLTFSMLIVLFSCSLSAQSDNTFVTEGKVWSQVEWNNSEQAFTVFTRFQGDTIISGQLYMIVSQSSDSMQLNWMTVGAIRENETHQVYYYNFFEEYLLYDFSLTAGENFSAEINGCQINMPLASIDTIQLLNGENRLRYNFTGQYWEQWIEGIGSSWGPLSVGHLDCSSDWYMSLNCFTENDTLKYRNSQYDDCYVLITGIAEFQNTMEFSINPNPFNQYATLKSSSDLSGCEVSIYSTSGILQKKYSYLSGQEVVINRDNLKAGLYFLHIHDDTGVRAVRKILITD